MCTPMAKAQIINFTVQSKINGTLYLKRDALQAKRIYILDAILFSVQNCAHLRVYLNVIGQQSSHPFLRDVGGEEGGSPVSAVPVVPG